jgi:hypothetical protein
MNVLFYETNNKINKYNIDEFCLGRKWKGKNNKTTRCCSKRKISKYKLYESNFCNTCIDYLPCGPIYRERINDVQFRLTPAEIKKGITLEKKGKQYWEEEEENRYKKWLKDNKIKETSGLKRNSNDKFYTKSEVVKTCIEKFKETIPINNNDLIIEPSAGSGSFTVELNKLGCDVYSTDIVPENDELVMYGDFFGIRPLLLKDKGMGMDKIEGDIHFVGNPPFGRQSCLAKKFIKECCEYDKCKSISFILPKSFRKDSMQTCFDLKFHLEKEIDLPNNSFQINGVDHEVPCVFQIWVKKDSEREVKEIEEPYGFHWVKKPEVVQIGLNDKGKPIKEHKFSEPVDFGILRAGGGNSCGRLSEEYLDGVKCYEQGWLFIQLDGKYDKELFKEKYKLIDFKNDDNVGMRSIAKPKFNEEINKILRTMD